MLRRRCRQTGAVSEVDEFGIEERQLDSLSNRPVVQRVQSVDCVTAIVAVNLQQDTVDTRSDSSTDRHATKHNTKWSVKYKQNIRYATGSLI